MARACTWRKLTKKKTSEDWRREQASFQIAENPREGRQVWRGTKEELRSRQTVFMLSFSLIFGWLVGTNLLDLGPNSRACRERERDWSKVLIDMWGNPYLCPIGAIWRPFSSHIYLVLQFTNKSLNPNTCWSFYKQGYGQTYHTPNISCWCLD